ncbi:hypothetical protein ACFFGV_06970 [Pontibacillus salicampi]|uniref:Uncharacterized protein n=1 Tax=Pontibacillus salicampi TaxID=1449801 RepID=A0ABV6LLZ0_9BACI
MNMLLEYILDFDLVSDPWLYSFYVSLFLSIALNRVFISLINGTSSWMTNQWDIRSHQSFQVSGEMNRMESANHIVSWIHKTIKKQESSSDGDYYLIIQ